MLADEFPEFGNVSPATLNGTTVRLHLEVDDVDAVCERAVAAGAVVLIPVADQFYGHRAGRLRDPFGHEWIVSTLIETVSAEEMQRRCDAMFAEQQ
jgi:PhnB protein